MILKEYKQKILNHIGVVGKENFNPDKLMIGLAVGYIVLPIFLFFVGWLKLRFIIILGGIILAATIRILGCFDLETDVSIAKNYRFWLISVLAIAIWVLFSGIGKFSYQTGDFIVRNPMYRDLQLYKWPVIYDLSKEPELAKAVLGESGKAMYVYYFTWWLPCALIGRGLYTCTNMSVEQVEVITDIAIYLWAVLGLFLTFYCLVKIFNRYSYFILSSLVMFGGLDIVMYYVKNNQMPVTEHIEWWAGGICQLFQYSSNTTQLYWVFNQSIPIWLIVAILMLMTKSRGVAAVAAMGFAYSPFATVGLVPIAIAAIVNINKDSLKKKILSAISFENLVVPVVMLAVFGTFYSLVLGNSLSSNGFIFATNKEFRTFSIYILFVVVEFGIYYIVMGDVAKKYRFYWITLIELLIIPMYRMGFNNDFAMRVSIPALFILMILCMKSFYEMRENGNKKGWIILLICLVIGYMTSASEIRRNVKLTLEMEQLTYINETEYSFGDMKTDSIGQIKLSADQYMAKERSYKYSAFYNIFMK